MSRTFVIHSDASEAKIAAHIVISHVNDMPKQTAVICNIPFGHRQQFPFAMADFGEGDSVYLLGTQFSKKELNLLSQSKTKVFSFHRESEQCKSFIEDSIPKQVWDHFNSCECSDAMYELDSELRNPHANCHLVRAIDAMTWPEQVIAISAIIGGNNAGVEELRRAGKWIVATVNKQVDSWLDNRRDIKIKKISTGHGKPAYKVALMQQQFFHMHDCTKAVFDSTDIDFCVCWNIRQAGVSIAIYSNGSRNALEFAKYFQSNATGNANFAEFSLPVIPGLEMVKELLTHFS